MNTSATMTSSPRTLTHAVPIAGFLAFGLLAAAYVMVLARFTMFPFQDFPNHLTRAYILADLLFHHGATFGSLFEFRLALVPYILGDLMLAALVAALGPTAAGILWNTLALLSWPAALFFLTHVNGLTRNTRAFVLLVGLFLASDWFFLLAFTQFRLGMALLVVAFGIAHLLRLRWSVSRFAWYCAVLLAGYFTHLAFVIFLAPCLVVSGAVRLYFRRTSVRTEVALLAPVLGIMLWHFGFADRVYHSEGAALYTWVWGPLAQKVFALQFDFLRFARLDSKLLMLGLGAVLCWGLWRDLRWRRLLNPPVAEMLALAFTFLCIYLVLPSRYSQAAYVDVRALALISLFLVMARVQLAEEVYAPAVALSLAALLAVLNLAYLNVHLAGHDAWMKRYREIVARIPQGATVLPIYTSGRDGGTSPRVHASSYIVMDRKALMPYLFSGDAGHPMKYFRYKRRPYAPTERWYQGVTPEPVDWQAIRCNYDLLLIGKPYDPKRIEVPTSPVAENSSAALLKVDSGTANDGCRRRQLP
jgi:hypothetical protein